MGGFKLMANKPFVSWAQLLAEAKEALANRSWESFFVSKLQNRMDMETSYTKLGNITAYIEWLEMKAKIEAEGESGALQFCIGGN